MLRDSDAYTAAPDSAIPVQQQLQQPYPPPQPPKPSSLSLSLSKNRAGARSAGDLASLLRDRTPSNHYMDRPEIAAQEVHDSNPNQNTMKQKPPRKASRSQVDDTAHFAALAVAAPLGGANSPYQGGSSYGEVRPSAISRVMSYEAFQTVAVQSILRPAAAAAAPATAPRSAAAAAAGCPTHLPPHPAAPATPFNQLSRRSMSRLANSSVVLGSGSEAKSAAVQGTTWPLMRPAPAVSLQAPSLLFAKSPRAGMPPCHSSLALTREASRGSGLSAAGRHRASMETLGLLQPSSGMKQEELAAANKRRSACFSRNNSRIFPLPSDLSSAQPSPRKSLRQSNLAPALKNTGSASPLPRPPGNPSPALGAKPFQYALPSAETLTMVADAASLRAKARIASAAPPASLHSAPGRQGGAQSSPQLAQSSPPFRPSAPSGPGPIHEENDPSDFHQGKSQGYAYSGSAPSAAGSSAAITQYNNRAPDSNSNMKAKPKAAARGGTLFGFIKRCMRPQVADA